MYTELPVSLPWSLPEIWTENHKLPVIAACGTAEKDQVKTKHREKLTLEIIPQRELQNKNKWYPLTKPEECHTEGKRKECHEKGTEKKKGLCEIKHIIAQIKNNQFKD